MFLGMPSLQDKVFTISIGNCAIILTRKILIFLLVTVVGLIILLITLKTKISSLESFAPKITNITWPEYRSKCGIIAFLSNPDVTYQYFLKHYQNANIYWEGYIVKLTTNANNHEDDPEHALIIFIRMIPDDIENGVSLIVALNKNLYNKHKEILAETKIGDKIGFNATLIGIGTDRQFLHLHGLGVKLLLNEHIEIPHEIPSYGRYEKINHEIP